MPSPANREKALDSALAQWMAKRKLGGVPVVLRRNLQFER